MAILVAICISICLVKKTNSILGNKLQSFVLFAFISYLLLSVLFNCYLEHSIGWDYGIPGVNNLAHFEGARAIAEGRDLSKVASSTTRFSLNPESIGYFIYAYFLYFTLYLPTIIDLHINLAITYYVQAAAAFIFALQLASFIHYIDSRVSNKFIFTLSILCPGLFIVTSLLLRDVWVFFFFGFFLEHISDGKDKRAFIFGLITCTLRLYMAVFIIPIYILKKWGGKSSLLFILTCCLLLIFGSEILVRFAPQFNILWHLGEIDPVECARNLLYPQLDYQIDVVLSNSFDKVCLGGDGVPGLYQFLAIWNIAVIVLSIFGLIGSLFSGQSRQYIAQCLIGMTIFLAMWYSIFYDASNLTARHKVMFLLPYAYFAGIGADFLKRKYGLGFSFAILASCISIVLLFKIVSYY